MQVIRQVGPKVVHGVTIYAVVNSLSDAATPYPQSQVFGHMLYTQLRCKWVVAKFNCQCLPIPADYTEINCHLNSVHAL